MVTFFARLVFVLHEGVKGKEKKRQGRVTLNPALGELCLEESDAKNGQGRVCDGRIVR